MKTSHRQIFGSTLAGIGILIPLLLLRSSINSESHDGKPRSPGTHINDFQDSSLIAATRSTRTFIALEGDTAIPRIGLSRSRNYFLEKYSSLAFEQVADDAGKERFIGTGAGVVIEQSGPAEELTGVALKVRVKTEGEFIGRGVKGLQFLVEVVNPASETWLAEHPGGVAIRIGGLDVVLDADHVRPGELWMTLSYSIPQS